MQTTQDCCLKVNRKMLVLRKMFVEEKLGHCPPPCGKILATPLLVTVRLRPGVMVSECVV